MGTHFTPKPAATGGTPNSDSQLESTDLTGGTPPVPITVWRTARTTDDTPGVIGARLAARIVSAYSQPGETVVDLTDGHGLSTACLKGARRHHPAVFTGATVTVDAASAHADAIASAHLDVPEAASGEAEETDELDDWFGDDLTDPLPPHTADAVQAGGDPDGRTSLIVANWPLHTDPTGNTGRLAGLLTGCRRLLRPGGCLVLVVGAGDVVTPAPEDFTGVVRAAADAGLGYLQHIVAVTAGTGGDRFTYYATDDDLIDLADAATTGGQHWYLHLRVNSDLLVFLAGPDFTASDSRDAGDARA
jgi:SAM-dependent methyltransferase